ncbi:MAG: hypothetical protein KatS3mg059_0008 [Thermomicrobiales bacterium]|nr:MAG: hypothetical protein KatS3mg059_0008 [Thermomicrobiales bacterium]
MKRTHGEPLMALAAGLALVSVLLTSPGTVAAGGGSHAGARSITYQDDTPGSSTSGPIHGGDATEMVIGGGNTGGDGTGGPAAGGSSIGGSAIGGLAIGGQATGGPVTGGDTIARAADRAKRLSARKVKTDKTVATVPTDNRRLAGPDTPALTQTVARQRAD